jgi:hypothetical protein
MKATLGGVPSVGHTLATSRGRMKVGTLKGVRKKLPADSVQILTEVGLESKYRQ